MASLQAGKGGANVGSMERLPSALAGAALVAYGLTRRNLPGVVIALAGGEMIYRGATGRCPFYGALGINTAEKGASPDAAVLHNENIQVRKSTTIGRPIEDLYAFWRNFENLPFFMRHLEDVEIIDDTHSHWVAKGPAGCMIEWDAEIINEQPNELISWKSMPGSGMPNAGSVLFARTPGDRRTIVTVELDYAPPAGPLGAMIAKMFGEEPALQIDEDLQRFKRLMEAGEVVEAGEIACADRRPARGKNAGRRKSSEDGSEASNGHGRGRHAPKDTVQEASEESFPASDSPAWT